MIRPAHTDEAAWARGLVRAAYQHYVPRMGREPSPMQADYAALIAAQEVHVLVEGGERVGLIVLRRDRDALFVENVAIDPGRRQRGHGYALMAFAEGEARRLGHGKISLYTHETMTENLRFYARLGFREVGRQEQDGFRRVFLEKHLDTA
ncbi:MAG TPA: GNAT family N-acetyltransferase [Stellaceae bacterium]|nr:GNAT family N-acetyltransferase [Stellaceae bacterium]